MFSQYDAQQIIDRLDPVEFYDRELNSCLFSDEVWSSGSLCPFHPNKEGNFFFNVVTGGFCCEQCGRWGENIIEFTEQKYHLPFSQAVSKIIQEWQFYE